MPANNRRKRRLDVVEFPDITDRLELDAAEDFDFYFFPNIEKGKIE